MQGWKIKDIELVLALIKLIRLTALAIIMMLCQSILNQFVIYNYKNSQKGIIYP